MSSPQDRFGVFLSGMPRLSSFKTEGRVVAGKRQVRRETAKIRDQASCNNDVQDENPARNPLSNL
jgi:hypothetical protein